MMIMEEYLNNLKALIGYNCVHYLWNDYVYLDITMINKVTYTELKRIQTILKTWSYISETDSDMSKGLYIYSFVTKDLPQQIRTSNLKELI